MESEILKKSLKYQQKGAELYRRLHKYAEEGMQLTKTVSAVKEELLDIGIPFYDLAGGVVATLGEGKGSILLRADMDALPMKEETGLEYASQSHAMHACGHDMHTASLLVAARVLKEMEASLKNQVSFCFQPGEEQLMGAKAMIAEGLLEKTNTERAYMVHVLTGTGFPAGTVIIPPAGVGASGVDYFSVRVKGKGCHGSMPHLGRDPIAAMCAVLNSLYGMIARETDCADGERLTIGRVIAGESSNVIPEYGEFFGTLRSYSDEKRTFLKERLFEVCRDISTAYRCSSSVSFNAGAPSFVNDRDARAAAVTALRNTGIEFFEVSEGTRGGGSEDFAYVSRLVPSLMLCISAGEGGALHSPSVVFDEGAIPYAAATYAALAMEDYKRV